MNEPRKIAIVFLAVGALGLLAVAWQWLRENGRHWLLLIGAAVVALVLALSVHLGHARDLDGRYANSPLKAWFDQLRSSGGANCCSDADGTAIADVDWETKNGRYRVRIDGQWFDVPDDAVVTEPNRAGRTMVWPLKYHDGSTHIRCFMPGPMT